jgi:DNA-binding response OmpR family regulator
MKKVLLAEDDTDFAGVLKQYLELHGFDVSCAQDGQQALLLLQQEAFDIGVFDVMMPKMDGFTLAEKIVVIHPGIPFVFLTARKMKEDTIKGLKLGADDYIVKPFEADELVLRLNNILKRASKNTITTAIPDTIRIGKYVFDTKRLELGIGNSIQKLTEKEAALLLFLYNNRNMVLKRELILKAVWENDDFFSGRSMDVFISRLRKYFAEDTTVSIISSRNIGLEFKIC